MDQPLGLRLSDVWGYMGSSCIDEAAITNVNQMLFFLFIDNQFKAVLA